MVRVLESQRGGWRIINRLWFEKDVLFFFQGGEMFVACEELRMFFGMIRLVVQEVKSLQKYVIFRSCFFRRWREWEKGGEGFILWTWVEGDFKMIEKVLEGLLFKIVFFFQKFLKSIYYLVVFSGSVFGRGEWFC